MIENKTKQRKPVESHFIDTKEATNIISIAKEEALTIIAAAAREAKQTIASDRTDATKLLASNAADAAKITNVKSGEDHDLLTTVNVKLDRLQLDIEGMKGSYVSLREFDELKLKFDVKNEKQDIKIEALETKTANYTITMVLYSIAVAFMIALTLYHMMNKG